MEVDERLNEVKLLNLRRYNGIFFFKSKENQMKIKKKKLLEGMKDWTNKTMVEEDEKLNKVRIATTKKK